MMFEYKELTSASLEESKALYRQHGWPICRTMKNSSVRSISPSAASARMMGERWWDSSAA